MWEKNLKKNGYVYKRQSRVGPRWEVSPNATKELSFNQIKPQDKAKLQVNPHSSPQRRAREMSDFKDLADLGEKKKNSPRVHKDKSGLKQTVILRVV